MQGTQAEYAERLGVSPAAVNKRFERGRLDGAKIATGGRRFLVDFEKADELWLARKRYVRRKKYVNLKTTINYNKCDVCGFVKIGPRRNPKTLVCSDRCRRAKAVLSHGGVLDCSRCGARLTLKDKQSTYSAAKRRPNNKKIKTLCLACLHKTVFEPEGARRRELFARGGRCTCCGGDFARKDMRPDKNLCKKCDYKRARAYITANPEKAKGYQAKHRERRLALKRKNRKIEVDTLADSYIRRILARYSHLTEGEFPPEMVELKRAEILLYRKLRERGVINQRGNVVNH